MIQVSAQDTDRITLDKKIMKLTSGVFSFPFLLLLLFVISMTRLERTTSSSPGIWYLECFCLWSRGILLVQRMEGR